MCFRTSLKKEKNLLMEAAPRLLDETKAASRSADFDFCSYRDEMRGRPTPLDVDVQDFPGGGGLRSQGLARSPIGLLCDTQLPPRAPNRKVALQLHDWLRNCGLSEVFHISKALHSTCRGACSRKWDVSMRKRAYHKESLSDVLKDLIPQAASLVAGDWTSRGATTLRSGA